MELSSGKRDEASAAHFERALAAAADIADSLTAAVRKKMGRSDQEDEDATEEGSAEVAQRPRECGNTRRKQAGEPCLVVFDGPRQRFCYSREVALRMDRGSEATAR